MSVYKIGDKYRYPATGEVVTIHEFLTEQTMVERFHIHGMKLQPVVPEKSKNNPIYVMKRQDGKLIYFKPEMLGLLEKV